MSERILKALMQLFAIIAKVEVNEQTNEISSDEKSRKVVSLFLKQELNQEMVKAYLELFDNYIDTHHGKSKRKDGKRKRTSVNSVKILRICTQINEELKQRQKVIVLIRIIEFINSDDEISAQELEFATTVAETFNISKEEFESCLNYVTAGEKTNISSENYLVVDNNQKNKDAKSKHIYSETIQGFLRIIQVPSVNTYFVRYYGNSEMYLNGQLLPPNRIQILTQGSAIRCPRLIPVYYSDIISQFLSSDITSKIVFNAQNIQFRFANKLLGLRDFSLSEESGKLIGIMGGSGAGKSTLLNVLNGNYAPSEGSVTINGINIYTEPEKLEGVIGFIPQDDLLIEELTVYQNLFYNSKLCFGNYSDEQINELVDSILKSIGLYETRDLKVGSPLEKTISGGQRKRLNISLLIGVNNQFNSMPIDEFEEDLNKLMNEMKSIKKNDGSIVIISIPDWGYTPYGESSDMGDISEQINLFNSSLRKFAYTNGLKYVDVTQISRRGINEPDLITKDSLHPSGIMYLEWAKKIYNIWID